MARLLLVLSALYLVGSQCWAAPDALQAYVAEADDRFSFTMEETFQRDNLTAHVLHLRSQQWRGIEWSHRLTILIPSTIRHPSSAMLFIGGGSNPPDEPVDLGEGYPLLATRIAKHEGIAVAILEQVPNQPLFDGLVEDDLIAYTFARQLETGDADWPLLFPMVKSTVRAMDAVSQFLKGETGSAPGMFLLTGASKRAWTTWLTAAVDSRVAGIIPIAFDMLNMAPQLERQEVSFDGYSEMLVGYEEENLFEQLGTDAGKALRRAVDPFSYREHLTMPKLILLGTNDPYWSVDAAGLYFNQLPGTKHLYHAANSGHRFAESMAPVFSAFIRRTLAGETLPQLQWETNDQDQLVTNWGEPDGEAWLWTAHSPTRNFHQAKWLPQRLPGEGKVTVSTEPPADGFIARYIEVRFPSSDGTSFGVCTEIIVTAAPGD